MPNTDNQPIDLNAVAAALAAYRKSHDHPAAFACCTAHAVADHTDALVAYARRLEQQRKFLIDQLAQRDAETGRGDKALREFLAGDTTQPTTPA